MTFCELFFLVMSFRCMATCCVLDTTGTGNILAQSIDEMLVYVGFRVWAGRGWGGLPYTALMISERVSKHGGNFGGQL